MVPIRITLLLGFLLLCKNVISAVEASNCGKFLSRYVFEISPTSNDIVRLAEITEKIRSAVVKRPKVDGRSVRVMIKPEDFENFYAIAQEENIYLNHRHVCIDPKDLNDLITGEYSAGMKLNSETGVLHPLGNTRYFSTKRAKKMRRFPKSKTGNLARTSLWNDWKQFDELLSFWKERIENTLRKVERKFNEIKRMKFGTENYTDIFSSSKMSSLGPTTSVNDTNFRTTDVVSMQPHFTTDFMDYAPRDRMTMGLVMSSGVRSTKGLWKSVKYTTRAPKDLKEWRRKQTFQIQNVHTTTVSSNNSSAKKRKGGKRKHLDKRRNADKAKTVEETHRNRAVTKKMPVTVKVTTRKSVKNHKTTSAPRRKKKKQSKSTTVRTKVSTRKPNLSESEKDKKRKHDSKASTKHYSKKPTTRSPKTDKISNKGQKKNSEHKRTSVFKNTTISLFKSTTASNRHSWEKSKVTSRTSMKPRKINKWLDSRNMSKSSGEKKYKNSTGMHGKEHHFRTKRDNWHFLRHSFEIYKPESHCPHPESAVGCGYGNEYTTNLPTTTNSVIPTEEGTATVESIEPDFEPIPSPSIPPPGLEPFPPVLPPDLDPEPYPPAPLPIPDAPPSNPDPDPVLSEPLSPDTQPDSDSESLPPVTPPDLDPEPFPPAPPPDADPEPLPPDTPPDLDPEPFPPAPPPDADPEPIPPDTSPDLDPEPYPPAPSPIPDAPPSNPDPDPALPESPSYEAYHPTLPDPPFYSDYNPDSPVPPPALNPDQPTGVEGFTPPEIGGGDMPVVPIPGAPGIPGIPGLPGGPGQAGGAGSPGGPGGPGEWYIPPQPGYGPGVVTTEQITQLYEEPNSTTTDSDEYSSITCESSMLSYAGDVSDYIESSAQNENNSKKPKTRASKKTHRLKKNGGHVKQ